MKRYLGLKHLLTGIFNKVWLCIIRGALAVWCLWIACCLWLLNACFGVTPSSCSFDLKIKQFWHRTKGVLCFSSLRTVLVARRAFPRGALVCSCAEYPPSSWTAESRLQTAPGWLNKRPKCYLLERRIFLCPIMFLFCFSLIEKLTVGRKCPPRQRKKYVFICIF